MNSKIIQQVMNLKYLEINLSAEKNNKEEGIEQVTRASTIESSSNIKFI